MIDPNQMSDEEREVLEEVAKAKGMTLEEALTDLGHKLAPEHDETVALDGQSQTEPEPAPVVIEKIAEAQPEADEDEYKFDVEDSTHQELPPPPAAEEEDEDEDAEEEDEDDPGHDSTASHICVQCGWNQENPVIPEPEHKDKISFLHAILGHKVFSKQYSMFGGHLRITLRSLTIRELDVLYQAAHQARMAGKFEKIVDYYEYLNRMRLYLQLTKFSSQSTSTHIVLPDGLSRDTHSDANLCWDEFLEKENCFDKGTSLIMQVEKYVVEKVMKTEHLQRTITHECSKFNRLAAKLEACVDNPDFWNETEQPS